jgi:hypothetical protein
VGESSVHNDPRFKRVDDDNPYFPRGDADVDGVLDALRDLAVKHTFLTGMHAPPDPTGPWERADTATSALEATTWANGERQYWQALTPMAGNVLSARTETASVHQPDFEPASDLKAAMMAEAELWAHAANPRTYRGHTGDEPADTNGGYPTFARGWLAKVAGCALARKTPSATREAAADLNTYLGLPEAVGLPQARGKRQGTAGGKAVPQFELDDDAVWRSRIETINAVSRNRDIQMMSMANAEEVADLGGFLDAAAKRVPGCARSTDLGGHLSRMDCSWASSVPITPPSGWLTAYDTDAAIYCWHRKTWKATYVYEFDLSKYDKGVSYKQQLMARDAWASVGVATTTLDSYLAYNEDPLITPLWTVPFPRIGEGATMVKVVGALRSGSIITSREGSFINRSMMRGAIARVWGHKKVETKLADGSLVFLVSSDDLMVLSDEELDTDQVSAAYASWGHELKVERARRMLRKNYGDAGAYNIVASLAQNSYFSEYPAEGRTALGQAALALAGRLSARVHPQYEPLLRAVLSLAPWLPKWIRDLPVVDMPPAILRAFAPEIERFLDRAASGPSSDWIARLYRDAPFSPGAREVLAYIQASFPSVLEGVGMRDASARSALRTARLILRSASHARKRDIMMALTDVLVGRTIVPQTLERFLRSFATDDQIGLGLAQAGYGKQPSKGE